MDRDHVNIWISSVLLVAVNLDDPKCLICQNKASLFFIQREQTPSHSIQTYVTMLCDEHKRHVTQECKPITLDELLVEQTMQC